MSEAIHVASVVQVELPTMKSTIFSEAGLLLWCPTRNATINSILLKDDLKSRIALLFATSCLGEAASFFIGFMLQLFLTQDRATWGQQPCWCPPCQWWARRVSYLTDTIKFGNGLSSLALRLDLGSWILCLLLDLGFLDRSDLCGKPLPLLENGPRAGAGFRLFKLKR